MNTILCSVYFFVYLYDFIFKKYNYAQKGDIEEKILVIHNTKKVRNFKITYIKI